MSTARPRISVIIIAHQRTEYLLDAIKSVVNQTLPRDEYEIVVVKDFQLPSIDEYLDQHSIAHVDFPTTTSTAGAMFRAGVERSSGDIVCFLDDDDKFHRQKLSYVVSLFDARPDVGYIHSRQRFVDSNGVPLAAQPLHSHRGHVKRIEFRSPTDYATADVRCGIAFNTSSIHIRREVLAPWLGPLDRVEVICDNFLGLIALLSGTGLLCTDEILSDYRLHGAGTSGAHVAGSQVEYFASRRTYYKRVLDDTEFFLGLIRGTVAEPSIRYFHEYCAALYELSDDQPHRRPVGRALLQLLRSPHQFVMYTIRPFDAVSFATFLLTYLSIPGMAKSAYFRGKKIASLFST
ncbi:MAG: glycosyltransferase family 2 protein [Thermoplasmata archaeon]